MIYLLCKYDIRTCLRQNLVIRFTHNNIRSFICRRHISSLAERYHTEGISPVPTGTDIIEKNHFCQVDKSDFFHGAGGGTRTHTVSLPTDFESVTSANSITPANISLLLYTKRNKKSTPIFAHMRISAALT